MRRAPMPVDVGAGFRALERHEAVGPRQAFMDLVGEASGLAAGGLDAGSGGDKRLPGIRADLDAGDDEKGIGPKARLRTRWT